MNGHGMRATAWMTTAALWTAIALALVQLPDSEMPAGWLLAFTAPAAVLALARGFPPWMLLRAVCAVLLQTGACLLALHFVGPLDRPAALACTILPPMAFVALRNQAADGALGLFLSFCVLLVGVILGGPQPWLLAGYVAAAIVALRGQARQQVLHDAVDGLRATPAARRPPLGSALLLTPLAALFAFAGNQMLAVLPSPSRGAGTAGSGGADGGRHTIGLPDSFDLDGGGRLIDLKGDRLVRVDCDDRAPADLYLRSGFFEVPGLDAWRVGRLGQSGRDTRRQDWLVREPAAGAAVRRLEVESYQGARNFVFVPPGVCRIRGIANLLGDNRREWFRQPPGVATETYEVDWQDLPAPLGPTADPQWRADLTALPEGLDRRPFEQLLAQWQPSGAVMARAEAIARGLARRCRYDRSEPVGPHDHALLNFLFAPGDRHGYCMHFASAAAILLRLSGVPCRIGVGLHGGDPVDDNPRARTFGSQHAHAWVEIPFAGRGWVVFDPTPPGERGRQAPAGADPGLGTQEPAATPADQAGTDALARRLMALLAQPWCWAIALIAVLVSCSWPGRRMRDARPVVAPQARPARRLLVRILRRLAAAGHPRQRGQTLEAYLAEFAGRAPSAPALVAAFTAYQDVRFGGQPFDGSRQAAMRAGLAAAEELPRPDDT